MTIAQEIYALRRANRRQEALALARQSLAKAPNDRYLKNAMGWLIFDIVKQVVSDYETQRTPKYRLVQTLNDSLKEYALLGLNDRPEILHSSLMQQAVKISQDWPKFLRFSRWWNLDLMRTEDRQSFDSGNGRALPSLEMRTYYAIARSIVSIGVETDQPLTDWSLSILDRALIAHPDDQWLHYYKSKILLKSGGALEAREHLLPVVRRQKRASWSWCQLAQTWEETEPAKAITCYYQALHVAQKEDEVLKARVQLAQLLAIQARFPEATVQIRNSLECRQRKGYRVPGELEQLVASTWYSRYAKELNLPEEPDVTREALALIRQKSDSLLEYRAGVIDNQNPSRSLAHAYFTPDDGIVIFYDDFDELAEISVGTFIEVGLSKDSGRAITIRQLDTDYLPGLCEHFLGEMRQNKNQSFAFVFDENGQRIFVPPALVTHHQDLVNSLVECLAVGSKDGKGKPGWKAICISKSG